MIRVRDMTLRDSENFQGWGIGGGGGRGVAFIGSWCHPPVDSLRRLPRASRKFPYSLASFSIATRVAPTHPPQTLAHADQMSAPRLDASTPPLTSLIYMRRPLGGYGVEREAREPMPSRVRLPLRGHSSSIWQPPLLVPWPRRPPQPCMPSPRAYFVSKWRHFLWPR